MVHCTYTGTWRGKALRDETFLAMNADSAKHLVEMWDATTEDYDYAVRAIRSVTNAEFRQWKTQAEDILQEHGVSYLPIGRWMAAGAGMTDSAFRSKVYRIMQKIARRYGGTASGMVAAGDLADGTRWSATISRHNASNGETFWRLDLTVKKPGAAPVVTGEFWDWDKLFEKAGIPVLNAGARMSSMTYPARFFTRPGAAAHARSYGILDVENEDLTAEGLAAKIRAWQEDEGEVPAYVYDDAAKRLKESGKAMPTGIRRASMDREAKIAAKIVADIRPRFDGKTPEEYAALWGSTRGQGAAHFYNYGSDRQVKDSRFYFQFMNGPGGIKDTMKLIQNSLVAQDGNFTQEDWEEMNRFARFISEEARRAG